MKTLPVLGYWNIRGLAQPIRVLLGYAGVEFEEIHYVIGDGPEFSYEDWYKEKFELGLDFPNLPYYMEGDLKLTQSNAILRHLARKHDLIGQTSAERARCDLAAEQICDLRKTFVTLCYSEDFKSQLLDYVSKLPKSLQPFEDFLGENPWLAGQNITWADFLAWEYFDQHVLLKPDCLASFPRLTAYHLRFKDEPKIKAFMESPKCFVGALRGKMAAWGGTYPVLPPSLD